MSQIGQRVFVAGGNQLYMTLANEEFVRPLGIGTNWTKLRLGLMMAYTPNGTNNLLTVLFVSGFCSGTAAPFGAASTTNFIGCPGVSGSNGTPTTLNYIANSGLPYFQASSNVVPIKRVGSVTTGPGSSIGQVLVTTNTGNLQRRSFVFVDITKGSPSWTVTTYWWAAAQVALDWSFANFLEAIEINGTPTVASVAMSGGSTSSVPFDETAGAIDTLDVYWNSGSFPVEIYGLGVYRFS